VSLDKQLPSFINTIVSSTRGELSVQQAHRHENLVSPVTERPSASKKLLSVEFVPT
jgi:hypothetical protein